MNILNSYMEITFLEIENKKKTIKMIRIEI